MMWIPNSIFFSFATWDFDWRITQTKIWCCGGFTKQKAQFWNSRATGLCLTYIGERRTTFAKAYGIKVRCYWELLRNCQKLGNSLLYWESCALNPKFQYFILIFFKKYSFTIVSLELERKLGDEKRKVRSLYLIFFNYLFLWF